jgi:hypothetical protein
MLEGLRKHFFKFLYLTIFVIIPFVLLPICIDKKINENACEFIYGYDAIISVVLIILVTNYAFDLVVLVIKKLYEKVSAIDKSSEDKYFVLYV